MTSTIPRIAIACGLAAGFLLWPGVSPGKDARRGPPTFAPVSGQEVVAGSYSCTGAVYTDGQPAHLNSFIYISATSGITEGFLPASQSSEAAGADLDALAGICEGNVSEVRSQVPSICTLGPVENRRGTFGNGESVESTFGFSCQGTRDEVIGVIGGFSRLSVTTTLLP